MQIDIIKSEGAIRAFARRVNRRLSRAAISEVKLEDIEQECWVAWCKARDSYDSQSGVPFLAFLRQGMMNHINRWLLSFEKQKQLAPFSANASVGGEDDTSELGELIGAEDQRDDFLALERVLEGLSERSRKFVELLINPPIELFREVEANIARVAFGRERGVAGFHANSVTSSLIFDLMGASRRERTKIIAEIRNLSEKINH